MPDSRAKTVLTAKNVINRAGAFWVPIFCASCHVSGGHVPEENVNFAFYLCDPCAERYGDIDGMYMQPDAVFFARVQEAQMEKYGRALTADETVVALDDPNSLESRLAHQRKALTPHT